MFDGESNIKNILNALSAKTKVDELKNLIPITEEEKKTRSELEEQKAKLQTLKKDKEIADLNTYKALLSTLKTSIYNNNKLFTEESIFEIKTAISDCLLKDDAAKTEGIENFKTDKLMNVGSKEWKNFISAAQEFAKQQIGGGEEYPKDDSYCILCQQPLSIEARKLIISYWAFIKSQSEQDAKTAQTVLNTHKNSYEGLKFDLLPAD